MRIAFNRTFSAAHRLHNDKSKCRNIHGHNYRVKVQVEGTLDVKQSMMVPFDEVKRVIDRYDHSLVLSISDPVVGALRSEMIRMVTIPDDPTTENLAHEIAQDVADLVRGPMQREVTVSLMETDNIQAIATVITSAVPEEIDAEEWHTDTAV